MQYKLIWKDGLKLGEWTIEGDEEYVDNEWMKVIGKYPYAKIVYYGVFHDGDWHEIKYL